MSAASRPTLPDIELPGPWRHRHISANGARFHVCTTVPTPTPTELVPAAGRPAAPLVVLLHGFPEFWWAWRHQLPALAAAGYRAVAMDLRGYGGSDKTPRGYDPRTLAADVAGVIRGLGARSAVLVGHGWGGYVAWTVATEHPDCVRALAVSAAPHPRALTAGGRWLLPTRAVRHLLAMQPPWLPERRIAKGDYVAHHLTAWSAPGSTFPTAAEAARYQAALALWPSPHCALEYHRWLFRSRLRSDGRAFGRSMRRRVGVPVVQLAGADDPAMPARSFESSARYVDAPVSQEAIAGAGHFPHEERPAEFNRALIRWLSDGAGAGVDGPA